MHISIIETINLYISYFKYHLIIVFSLSYKAVFIKVLLYKASSFVQKDFLKLLTYNSMKLDLYVRYFFIAYNCIPRTKYLRGILWFSRRSAAASAAASADTSSFS